MNYIITSIRIDLLNVSVTDDILMYERLIRPQQAGKRFAYNRLLEGAQEKTLWHTIREISPWLTGVSGHAI